MDESVTGYGSKFDYYNLYRVRLEATAVYKITYVHPNGLTVLTGILNLHLLSDHSSNKTER